MLCRTTRSRPGRFPLAAKLLLALTVSFGLSSCSDEGTNVLEDSNRVPFELSDGPATVTQYDGSALGKCGLTGTNVMDCYPGFSMAAIPGAFFTDILPSNGVVACSAESNVAVDELGEPLCYELSGPDGTTTVKVIVADVCGGGCSSNIASCKTANPEPTCAAIASCLDCTDNDFATQFEPRWRCSPAMTCLEQTQGIDWTTFEGPILAATMGLNQGTEGCEVSGFIPTGLFPNANVDWCSGDNPHFDVWGPPSTLTNTVVNYVRIACPDPAPGCLDRAGQEAFTR